MGIKLVVAVTDGSWFEQLRARSELNEVNFWAPSAVNFRALSPGELFLFKLHAPRNFIVGGGIFAYSTALPCSLAWDAFGAANGVSNLIEMRERIGRYRREPLDHRYDFEIGCRILTQPFFFEELYWIPVPKSWSSNIVSFKTYDTNDQEAFELWGAVMQRCRLQSVKDAPQPRYGSPQTVQPRLGQGAFRVLVTDAYRRRCAISGEKTLPALEAAHIRPYAEGGEHSLNNGLLLRRDIHSLFDAGYVTVTPDLRFEVSRRIRDEFENGREYYKLHGQGISTPEAATGRPDASALAWHNDNRFKG
ncbi:MAG: HNH endonuclease [Pseudomonadales bacterium]